MEFQNEFKDRLERNLLEVSDFYRGLIVDLAEQELGRSENWKFIRGRLLKALGDRGLVGRIREVINAEFNYKRENL